MLGLLLGAPGLLAQAPAGAPDSAVLGTFQDDYGNRFSISSTAWRQLPRTVYRVVRWNAREQYLVARNGEENAGDRGLWTRIDWMALPGMAPYTWAFCLSAYKAASAAEAESTHVADRSVPKTGCNGYPFSRMQPVAPAGIAVLVRAELVMPFAATGAPKVALTIVNGLEVPVTHLSMGLVPNGWNGEAFGAGPVDIYRNDAMAGLYQLGPTVTPPRQVQGASGYRISPGDSLRLVLDLGKWKIAGGWTPGRYRITFDARNLAAEDNRVQFRVTSDTLRFTIRR